MRKHIVNCQIEEMGIYCLEEIQNEMNSYYVQLLANIIKKMKLTKKEQVEAINKICENYNKGRDANANRNLQPQIQMDR